MSVYYNIYTCMILYAYISYTYIYIYIYLCVCSAETINQTFNDIKPRSAPLDYMELVDTKDSKKTLGGALNA